jgi:hypothetical protein
VIAGSRASYRSFALAAALVGWAAVALQSYITINNSLSAGHGIGHGLVVFFGFFTVTTNIFMALVLTAHGLGSRAPFWALFRRPVVITSAAACMIVVGITYFFLLRRLWNPQGLQHVVDVALHYVMPTLAAIFWWVVVPRGTVGWSRVGSMLVYPMVYLVYVFVRGPLAGSYPYYFIDVNTLGLARSLLNAAALAAFFLLVLAVMILASNHRARGPSQPGN